MTDNDSTLEEEITLETLRDIEMYTRGYRDGADRAIDLMRERIRQNKREASLDQTKSQAASTQQP